MPKRNKAQLTNGSLIFFFASVCRAQKYSKLQRQLYLQGERLDQDILSLHSDHFTRNTGKASTALFTPTV